jgi:shikimate kinase / 3-dehydroquinate synthase
MMAAAYLAHELGRIDDGAVALHRRVLERVGLPVRADLELDALEEAWKRDKKYERGVRFVLLASIGRAESGIAAPRDAVAAAVERLKT